MLLNPYTLAIDWTEGGTTSTLAFTQIAQPETFNYLGRSNRLDWRNSVFVVTISVSPLLPEKVFGTRNCSMEHPHYGVKHLRTHVVIDLLVLFKSETCPRTKDFLNKVSYQVLLLLSCEHGLLSGGHWTAISRLRIVKI